MNDKTIKLIDPSRQVVAVVRATEEEGHWSGGIDLSTAPADVRVLFGLFEELVNGQEFSCIDETEARIEALGLRAVFEDNTEAAITDLQVYPSTGEVSFRITKTVGVNGEPAPAPSPQRS